MSTAIPRLTDDAVRRCTPPDEEAGFGSLATPRGHLPLKAMDVQARIDGLLAEVAVTQIFVNTLNEAVEATYVFPLPDRAAVTRFRMEVGGRVIEGTLKERGAARREYDQAIQAGHRAAITEEERPGTFTLRVGNLMPGESATVRLTLAGPMPYSDGEATFRFPLVVAPRYIPGTPLPGASVGDGMVADTDAVPDASRISPPVLLPGFPNPVRLSLMVDVAPSAIPLDDFRSTLHAVLDVISDDGARRIVVQPGERLDRDFILRFRVGDEALRTSLTLTPDADGAAEGTFALTVVPPVNAGQGRRPRDIVFVLDRSGSMAGWKIVAARRALGRMVDTLTEGDRFAVYAFDDRIETPPAFANLQLHPATDRNRFRAAEFLAGVNVRGGTEMAEPLALAVHQLANSARPSERILVLITDGQVGNEDQILRRLGEQLRGVRIFTLGIDKAVNAAFLRRLADLGGGACELVESEERLDEVLAQVHRRIDTPVLTGLRLEASGLRIEEDSVVPRRLPDLFVGAPLCVLGRYRGAPEGSVRLSAAVPGGDAWSHTAAARVGGNAASAAVWARGHLRDLEDRFVTHPGEARVLETLIVAVSLRFGVLCRFTAFVAVDRDQVVNPGGEPHHITQPVEAPAGWQANAARALQYCVAAPVQAQQRGAGAGETDALRREIASMVVPGKDMVTMGRLPQTPQAKKAIEYAVEEARTMHHPGVDVEHLLLGLLREELGLAADSLKKIGLTLETARDEIRSAFAWQATPDAPAWPKDARAEAYFTTRIIEVIRFANQQSQNFNHEYIGTEHLLLGILDEGTGVAARILNRHKARRQALELLQRLESAEQADTAGRLLELNLLAMRLEPLLKDFESGITPARKVVTQARRASEGSLACASGLCEDLPRRSNSVPVTELRLFKQLLAGVRALLSATAPDQAEVDRLWTEALAVLRAFAGAAEPLPNAVQAP